MSPTLNMAFRSFELQIGELFPNEQLLKKEKDCGYRANNFSLGNVSAIHSSKNLNATFNFGEVTEYVYYALFTLLLTVSRLKI